MDMKKFYDNIDLDLMLKAGKHLSFPMLAMIMIIEVALGPRTLLMKGQAGQPIVPGNGILAGCPAAVSCARCFLFAINFTLLKEHPRATIRQFVDDLRIRVTDEDPHRASILAARALHRLLKLLSAAKCQLALTKCVILSSHAIAGRMLRRHFGVLG